jgi:hypothetical protein
MYFRIDLLHELVEDGFLNQDARRAGADLAFIEAEQREPFQRLTQELVIFIHHVGELY